MKVSNKQKVIDAMFELLRNGRCEISGCKIANLSGVDVSNVYRIIKNY